MGIIYSNYILLPCFKCVICLLIMNDSFKVHNSRSWIWESEWTNPGPIYHHLGLVLNSIQKRTSIEKGHLFADLGQMLVVGCWWKGLICCRLQMKIWPWSIWEKCFILTYGNNQTNILEIWEKCEILQCGNCKTNILEMLAPEMHCLLCIYRFAKQFNWGKTINNM